MQAHSPRCCGWCSSTACYARHASAAASRGVDPACRGSRCRTWTALIDATRAPALHRQKATAPSRTKASLIARDDQILRPLWNIYRPFETGCSSGGRYRKRKALSSGDHRRNPHLPLTGGVFPPDIHVRALIRVRPRCEVEEEVWCRSGGGETAVVTVEHADKDRGAAGADTRRVGHHGEKAGVCGEFELEGVAVPRGDVGVDDGSDFLTLEGTWKRMNGRSVFRIPIWLVV